jgi:hypothetical protein
MKQTQKRYIKTGSEYQEHPQGVCIGFEWADAKGVLRRVVYHKSVDDLEARTTTAVSDYQIFDDLKNRWITSEPIISTADMHSYLYADTGIYEPEPYITTENEGQLVQTLKPNLVPQFLFLYQLQLQLFESLIKNIQVLKFGATSFE